LAVTFKPEPIKPGSGRAFDSCREVLAEYPLLGLGVSRRNAGMGKAGRYLYRALRPEEISRRLLIPKSQEKFLALPRLGIDTHLPFILGENAEHAVRQHQWQQHGFDTRGVSTTPHLARARHYARKYRVIAVIDRTLFSALGIDEFVVNDCLARYPRDIACIEDDEVILVSQEAGPLPAAIIVGLIE
jgi:hypothetical protein